MSESTPNVKPVRRRAPRPRAADTEPSAAMRIQILKAAAKAFRQLGYHGATVEQIAAALEMKKGNLYYYFENKEDILFACHQYSLDRLLELLQVVRASGLPPDQQLRRLLAAFVQTILDELHGTALFLDLEALSPPHLKIVISRRDLFDRGVRAILEEGMAAGDFAPADSKLQAFAIFGAINWIPRWFDPSGRASSQEISDRFADFFLTGLRKR